MCHVGRNLLWNDCFVNGYIIVHDRLPPKEFTPRNSPELCIASRVDNPRNPKFFTQGGAPSMDKVFILTSEEIEKYLPAQQERALGKWWWVRMPGCNLLSAVSVCEDGSIYDIGINVNYESGGVRPALWVLLRV